jgi:plasmid stabilization system protein ParE
VDYRLLYTQKALKDLAEIIGHIAEDDAQAASRFGSSLVAHVELLARFPHMGGAIRKRPLVRKLLHSPFLVYYQVSQAKREISEARNRGSSHPPWGTETTKVRAAFETS